MNPLLDLTDTQYAVWRVVALGNATNPQLLETSQSKEQYARWRSEAEMQARNDSLPISKSSGGYQPVQWSSEDDKEMFYITDNQGTSYFFDAVFKTDMVKDRRITQHPVQTGANISDHSYQVPTKLMMEIGVSDIMSSYSTNQWESDSRSISAYEKIVDLQKMGQPLSVSTRLDEFENMVIISISVKEDSKTRYSLRAEITLQEILTATVVRKKISAASKITDKTGKGENPTIPKAVTQTPNNGVKAPETVKAMAIPPGSSTLQNAVTSLKERFSGINPF